MRYLLLFFALWCCWHASRAQASAPFPQAELLYSASPASDTAAAIHLLFAARRARSYLITAIIVVPGVAAYLADGNSIGTAAYPLAAGPYELANLICHRCYRKKMEERALLNFRSHQLSPQIRRRLKPKYFTDAPALKHF